MSCFIAAIVSFISASVAAQGIELTTEVKKVKLVKKASGTVKRILVSAKKVVPGEEIVYFIAIKNNSEKPIERIQITDPIPKNMRYLAGTAENQDTYTHYSIDGGILFAKPEKLFIENENVLAKVDNYTHIRWTLKPVLNPGETKIVSFSAILN